jgi:hypothetical protein
MHLIKIALAVAITVPSATASAPVAPPDPSAAVADFATYCGRSLAIWRKSLCGPLIFVDPVTRAATANTDPGGGFTEQGSAWIGTLPKEASLSNTSIVLGGKRFAEMILPLPSDAGERRILLAHESFHRIQPDLGFHGSEADNSHLDSKDGRIAARLEIAALKAALRAKNWRAAARDALAFREQRLREYPNAEAAEASLLANEGLAEYTGVRVGTGSDASNWAIKRLDSATARPSLIRSFGYVVGPAYGLLLDRTHAGWRSAALKGEALPALLAARIGGPSRTVTGGAYDQPTIVEEENARDLQIQQRRAALLAEFEQAPTVTFPFEAMNIEFDPNSLFSLGEKGSVYSRATTIRDKWGAFHSTSDVLLASDWSYARLPGPATADGATLSGPGWSAELASGYSAAAEGRAGSLVVKKQ